MKSTAAALLVLLALVGCLYAVHAKPAQKKYKDGAPKSTSYMSHSVHVEDKNVQIYHGMYGGKCGGDGLYYNNEYSFIICSNGNAYEQHCAPGSRNSGYGKYKYGKDYYYHDFCDVNMVDGSYSVEQAYSASYGTDYKPGYEAPTGATYGQRHEERHVRQSYAVQSNYDNDYVKSESYRKEPYDAKRPYKMRYD